ncbi:cytochrome P450 [Streptomyces sp. SID161]|uniref:cytochrome P450 n=1 Tax=Streptomyces sp. SID161 TaxID=2690251 RepID=UPI0013708278|nr:cytochrome P450 [Streptomyces sp. SID161]MYW41857.1 cytochrome P450 [Streptomyces sp. SID161]
MDTAGTLIDCLMRQFPFDVSAEEFVQDPYPWYEEARRRHGPVHRTRSGDLVVLGYFEAQAVLRDPRFGHGAQTAQEPTGYGVPARTFLLTDPPGHTRQRERVRRAFTARELLSLRRTIGETAADLVAAAARSGTADVVADVARPLSARVVADLIGVPEDLRDRFTRAASLLVRGMDPPELIDPGTQESIARARLCLARDIGAALRRPDSSGLLRGLAQDADGPAARAETVATCAQLVAAGYETTVGLIGNGMHALLGHPGELARLTAGGHSEQVTGRTVEELLRFDPPIQLAPRSALVDADIAGTPVPRGAVVSVLLGAANRDPRVFPEPHRLRLDRQPRHLAFGLGSHYCLGAALARLEATAALRQLLRHRPRPTADRVTYSPARVARSVRSLRVRLTPEADARP